MVNYTTVSQNMKKAPFQILEVNAGEKYGEIEKHIPMDVEERSNKEAEESSSRVVYETIMEEQKKDASKFGKCFYLPTPTATRHENYINIFI